MVETTRRIPAAVSRGKSASKSWTVTAAGDEAVPIQVFPSGWGSSYASVLVRLTLPAKNPSSRFPSFALLLESCLNAFSCVKNQFKLICQIFSRRIFLDDSI